ncbi:amidohydrolase [Fodinicola acaciae]|uniref:amidohydrolase n=1 Tax=Fodinicola acaciae TaxID=2681555 RepID=UPI0013D7C8CD|nr:amidohydrolase [Fodinicola acaciae]
MILVTASKVVVEPGAYADAFAVADGRVVANGPLDLLRERYPDADVLDFPHDVVVPGFHDAHIHLGMASEDLLHLDLSPDAAPSLGALVAAIGADAAKAPAGAWIRGSRYDDAKMPEGRVLDRWDLDEVAPDHPVLVLHVAGHWGVMNSVALGLAGITDESEPPPGGDYGRDGSGHVNGVLYERALFDVAYSSASRAGQTVVPASTRADKLVGLGRALEKWHAAGLTSICDALVGPDEIGLFSDAKDAGLLTMRTGFLVGAEHYEMVRKLDFRSDLGDEWLRFVGVKAFVDGAIGGRTCLLDDPGEHIHGIQATATKDLHELVRTVHGDGRVIGVHANGDKAIRIVLDAYEAAQAADPRPGLRHRIEHCSVVDDDILRRMKDIDAMALPFASYVHYHGGKLIDWYGEERVSRMFAHRSFLDAGVTVAASSDYPCGPYEPLVGMHSMVTRRGFDGVEIGPSQRISAAEALAMYTVNAAVTVGGKDPTGRLTPGGLADFVVLSADPLTSPDVSSIDVRATYVGGNCVFAV